MSYLYTSHTFFEIIVLDYLFTVVNDWREVNLLQCNKYKLTVCKLNQ